jgi:hypothetical protein
MACGEVPSVCCMVMLLITLYLGGRWGGGEEGGGGKRGSFFCPFSLSTCHVLFVCCSIEIVVAVCR